MEGSAGCLTRYSAWHTEVGEVGCTCVQSPEQVGDIYLRVRLIHQPSHYDHTAPSQGEQYE